MATTYQLISSVTVGSGGASSIDFTSIPATYTDLCLLATTRDASESYVQIQFNGDTTAGNYSGRFLRGNGTNAASSTTTFPFVGVSPSTSYTANTFGNLSIYIPNYAGSSNKSLSADGVSENNNTTAYSVLSAGLWSNTSAITSIKLIVQGGGTFQQYSTAYLYGIKNS